MKRANKLIEKRTYSMKGAIASFVTICKTGANFTPFSQLKYGESEKFGQDIEVSRIEFAKTDFATKELVEAYLTDNSFEDFSVNEDADVFYVDGIESDKFEDIQQIELETGVKYFIGKLKEAVEVEAPAAEIIASVEFQEPVVEPEIEQVQESVEDIKVEDEEAQPEGEEATSEEVSDTFTPEEIKEEVTPEEEITNVLSIESVAMSDEVVAKFDALEAMIVELREKLSKFEEKEQVSLDETPIVIQNSNAVNSDEIIKVDENVADKEIAKFSIKRNNDLFGLRG